jgi:hypothetical protein
MLLASLSSLESEKGREGRGEGRREKRRGEGSVPMGRLRIKFGDLLSAALRAVLATF